MTRAEQIFYNDIHRIADSLGKIAEERRAQPVKVCKVHTLSMVCIDGGHCEASHDREKPFSTVRCDLVKARLIVDS